MRQSDTRGLLHPEQALQHLTIHRAPPSVDLAPWVEWLWGVQWDLPEGRAHHQETLPAPCVHLVWEDGGFSLHGPGTKRFVITLRGRGWVRGVRFRPAGFRGFHARSIRELADRVVPAATLLDHEPPAPSSFDAAGEALHAYLRANGPRSDPKVHRINDLVEAAQRQGSTLRVEGLATRAGISTRSLHRLFADYVGVSSKWIVRRARVHAAAERVKRGAQVDWAELAIELGYSDQAHLIRDFRAQIGCTPAEYARRCAS